MKKLIAIIALTALLILPVQSVIASSTLWQHYTEKGQNLPSISSRAVLYENIAKDLYRGTAKQNIALLAYLEGGSNNNFDLNSIFTSFGLPNYGDNTLVGGNVPNTATGWHLSIPHASSDTTITLEDFDDLRGNSVTDFPTKIYLVVEPENTNNTEIVMCPLASISTTSYYFASCTRGLAFSGTSEASVTANKKAHPAGARVIMTNVGQFFNNFVDIDSAQSIGGVKTFTSIPKAPTSTPTNDQELITLYQFQQATSTGGIIGSESVKGVWEGATQNEMGGGVATGTSGAYLVPQSQYMGTSSSARIMIPVTEADGDINAGFIGQDQNYTWSGTNSWSSTSTFSATTTFNSYINSPYNYIFGTGLDGASTTATTTLTSDVYFTNLTVGTGTTLSTGGYKIFVSGTLTNNGTINNSGTSGVLVEAGIGGVSGTLRGGGVGGHGAYENTGRGGGGGGGGGFILISTKTLINNGTIRANGGNGGAGSGDASAASAKATSTPGSIDYSAGGAGGTGGTSANQAVALSAGTVTIAKQKLYIPSIAFMGGYDPILLKAVGGGAGGSGGNTGTGVSSGGGGGGGGGVVVIFYNSATFGTETASAGTGGAGGGTGTVGANGSAGNVYKINIQ